MKLSDEELKYGSMSMLYVVVKNDRIYIDKDLRIKKTAKICKNVDGYFHKYYRCINDEDVNMIDTVDDTDSKSYFIYVVMKKHDIFDVRRDVKEANSIAKDIDGRVIRYVKTEGKQLN